MAAGNLPELKLKSLPKTLIKMRKNISDLPYGFFESSPRPLNFSLKSSHRHLKKGSEEISKTHLHSFTPDPYIISFKSEIQKALDYIKKEKPVQEVKKFERIPTIRYRNRDELEVKSFLDALFSNEQSPFKKNLADSDIGAFDVISAEKILLEAKKIIKSGVKKKKKEHKISDDIEDFWLRNISKERTVKWDTFEDNFVSFLISYMIIDFGIIRKVNWRNFLNKICERVGKDSVFNTHWVGCPAYPTIPQLNQKIIALKDFASAVVSQVLAKLLFMSIDELPNKIKHTNGAEYIYSCGCSYKGQWKEGKREGSGLLKMCSQETYEGTFSNSLFNDFGSLHWSGFVYKGFFHKGKLHGFGRLTYPNAALYEGLFDKGLMVNGTLRWTDGQIYQGELSNGVFEGKGKLTTSLGEITNGMWSCGRLNGEAVIISKDGSSLKGIFENGVLSKPGKLKTEAYTYRGEFLQSLPHGKGSFNFSSRIMYTGEVQQGKIDGFGVMSYPNGDKYEGFFIDGVQSGLGKIMYANGRVFEGQVDNGKPTGTGIFIFPPGEVICKYDGEVKDGVLEGKGEAWFNDRSYFKGEFKQGQIEGVGFWKSTNIEYDGSIVGGVFNGFGSLKIPSGSYIGVWTNGRANGKGDAKDYRDNTYSGMFKDGQPVMKNKLEKQFLDAMNSVKVLSNF